MLPPSMLPTQYPALRVGLGRVRGAQMPLHDTDAGNINRDGNDHPAERAKQAGNDNSMPSSDHCGAQPVICSTPATIATMASEIGKNTFQPSRINWS